MEHPKVICDEMILLHKVVTSCQFCECLWGLPLVGWRGTVTSILAGVQVVLQLSKGEFSAVARLEVSEP